MFMLFVSLYLKYVSFKQYKIYSCFLKIQSDNPCLLIGIFIAFAFSVIIEMALCSLIYLFKLI